MVDSSPKKNRIQWQILAAAIALGVVLPFLESLATNWRTFLYTYLVTTVASTGLVVICGGMLFRRIPNLHWLLYGFSIVATFVVVLYMVLDTAMVLSILATVSAGDLSRPPADDLEWAGWIDIIDIGVRLTLLPSALSAPIMGVASLAIWAKRRFF